MKSSLFSSEQVFESSCHFSVPKWRNTEVRSAQCFAGIGFLRGPRAFVRKWFEKNWNHTPADYPTTQARPFNRVLQTPHSPRSISPLSMHRNPGSQRRSPVEVIALGCRDGRLLLIALGILTFFWHIAALHARGPYFLGSNSDPDYTYLLNSLNIERGLRPFHVDHPGTLVQLMGGAILWVCHFAATKAGFVADVIRNPEHFLRILACTFMALYSAVVTALACTVRRSGGGMLAALAVQLTPFFSATIPLNVTSVAPEVVLLTLAVAMAAALFAVLRGALIPSSPWTGVLFGVIMGASIATKVTSVPWILLPLFLVSGGAAWAAYALATLFTCAALTMPAWPRLGYTLWFFERIATHSGRYGLGPPGLLDPDAYGHALARLLASEPILVVAMLASMAAILVDRRRQDGSARTRRALAGLVVVQVLSVLLVARHPGDIPFDRYLLPALGLVGTSAALSWTLLAPILSRHRTAGACAALLVAGLAAFQCNNFVSVYRNLEVQRDKQASVVAYVRAHIPDSTVVYVYRASNRGFALNFGNDSAGNYYTEEIARAFPNARVWNIWAGQYELGPDTDAVQLFEGSPGTFDHMDWKRALGKQAKPVFGNDLEELCELK